jgi:hypothetical protein
MATANATMQILAGQVERGCCQEWLRHEHAYGDQCAVNDVVLPKPFLFKL